LSASHIFIIKQGKTFEQRFEYKTGTPSLPFDFTGYEVRAQIRSGYGPNSTLYCTLSSSIQPDGTGFNMNPVSASLVLPRSSGSIGMKISAFSSSQFNFDTAYIDIEFYSGSGVTQYVKELISGKVKLLKEVTTIGQ
jgi:hypothetical protein